MVAGYRRSLLASWPGCRKGEGRNGCVPKTAYLESSSRANPALSEDLQLDSIFVHVRVHVCLENLTLGARDNVDAIPQVTSIL